MAKSEKMQKGSDSERAPLPDRTRVELSPFAENAQDTAKHRVPIEDDPPPRASRKSTSQPSIIVDDALDVEKSPPARKSSGLRRPKNGHAPEEDLDDEPPAEEPPENATRISPAPDRRPARPERPVADENATSAGPPISVEVISGPDEGVRLPIRGGRMIVGRGDGCDLKLTDASASRRHVELTVGPAGLVMRDLGSGNGTRVNGKREVEAVLAHRDEVSLGETVLRMIDELKRHDEEQEAARAAAEPRKAPPRRPGAPAVAEGDPATGSEDFEEAGRSTGVLDVPPAHHLPPAARPNLVDRFRGLPKQMRILVIAGLVLVFVVILATMASSVTPKPVVDPNKGLAKKEAEYTEVVKEAKRLLMDKKYAEALARYQDAKDLIDKPELAKPIEFAERNLKAKKLLDDAVAASQRADWDNAIAKVKDMDGDSDLADSAKDYEKKWTAQRDAELIEKIKTTAQSGDFGAARALVDKVPSELQENLRRDINDIEKQYANDKAGREHQAAVNAVIEKKRRAAQARMAVDQAVEPVVHKIELADFDGALRQCDRVAELNTSPAVIDKLKTLKRVIPGFGQAYTDGMSRFNGGAAEQAAPSLLRAFTLLEDMDIDSPKAEGQLRSKAAQALALKGRAAANRNEYGTAAHAYKDALKLSPESSQAREGLAEIRRHAQEVYETGYTLKERDPEAARRHFKDVIEMVPAGEELAKKAAKRLEELETR
jgi:tetratricopeptide (TPR) repeat protein